MPIELLGSNISFNVQSDAKATYFSGTLDEYQELERTQQRAEAQSSPVYENNSDAVKVSIFSGKTSPAAQSEALLAVQSAVDSFSASRNLQRGLTPIAEAYTEKATYERRTLNISIKSDEGDVIKIATDLTASFSETQYDSARPKSGKSGGANSGENISVQGNIGQQEQVDVKALLAKAQGIADLSEKVGRGEATEEELDKAIADLGNGDVDNNSLASFKLSVDVDQANYVKQGTSTAYVNNTGAGNGFFALNPILPNYTDNSGQSVDNNFFAKILANYSDNKSTKYSDNSFFLELGRDLLNSNVKSIKSVIDSYLGNSVDRLNA